MLVAVFLPFYFIQAQASEPDLGEGGETRVESPPASQPAGGTAPVTGPIPSTEFQQLSPPPEAVNIGNLTFTPPPPPAGSWLGLVPCDGSRENPCDFNAFMALINKVIRFILFALAIPIAAIMFAYAGFLMVTSGGSTEARGKAKKIFTNAAYGLVIAATAWLIVRTILSILGYDGAWIGFPFILTP